MTEYRKELFGERMSENLNDLSKGPAGLPLGKSFIDHAASRLDPALKFGAMAIRIDDFDDNKDVSNQKGKDDLHAHAADAVDTVCRCENGLLGQIDNDTLGCFLPEKSISFCLEAAGKIQKNLEKIQIGTVSIGIAVYPFVDYKKSLILENALKALDHAAFFGPGSIVAFDAVSLNISGDRFYQQGDIDNTVKEFKRALLIDPLNYNIHNSLGVCYGTLGDYEKAIEEFETALWLEPGEIMALYNKGVANLLRSNKDKALEHFMEAYGIKEDMFEPVFQIGRLHFESDEFETGKEFFEKATRLNPESAMAFRYLGECCDAVGLTDEATAAYKNAVKQNPNDAASLSALGRLFDIQDENIEIAEIFCRKSVEISSDNGLFRHRLGLILLKQGKLEDALKEFQAAKALEHDSGSFIEDIKNRITRTTVQTTS